MLSEPLHLHPAMAKDNSVKLDWKKFSKAFLDATPDGIAVLDLNLKTIISNIIAQEALSLFPGTLLKSTLPELSDKAEKVLGKLQAESTLLSKQENSHFSVILSPIMLGGNPLGILCIFRDITAFESIKDSLISYQDLSIELDTVITSSNDGLWICDGEGNVLRMNPASERLNCIKASDIVGKNMQELIDSGLIDKSVTLKVIKSRKKESIFQKVKTGKKLFLTANPVFDKDGRLFRVVVNERDITEIENLKQRVEDQEALKDQYKRDLLEMQIEESESKKIICKSSNYKLILEKAIKLAKVDSTVLILGESGTGKGVIADLIHKYSSRADKPMIKLNCGTIPESLVESELFGYEKGAFTGAGKTGKPGRFEMADNGIIFLDEIGELPLSSQVKLLRFLEDGKIIRVGGTKNKTIDTRVIAATNRDIKNMLVKRTFRKDLYYRLNVVPLTIPPLRERKECILPLIAHYLDYFCDKYKKKQKLRLKKKAIDALFLYTYPGNVRELINICERLVVMHTRGDISHKDLPQSVIAGKYISDMDNSAIWDSGLTLRQMLEKVEKKAVDHAFKKYKTQAEAAKALGLNQSTIARKLKKYALG